MIPARNAACGMQNGVQGRQDCCSPLLRTPRSALRIGIFGGTFNPVHLGHLLLAETAREQLKLDRVLFIPTGQPPHKSSRGLLPGKQRLALVKRAIQGQPGFAASDLELQRSGPSYSIQTVQRLRARFPRAALFLLMGEDMLRVPWRAWHDLMRLCTVVVAHRSANAPARSPHPARHHGTAPASGRVRWLEMPVVEISSSGIRRRLRAGRSIRYLVPPAVERYIRQHHLYR